MSPHVHIRPIVDRIVADPELGLCVLQAQGVELLIRACELLEMPEEWLEGKRPLHPDIAESLVLLLGNVLQAVRAEIADPTRPMHAVSGGGK